MASWIVFEPPARPPGSFEAAEESVFVKDGWCWPALLIPPVWLLWRRMWLVFLFWLLAMVAINLAAAASSASDVLTGAAQTLFALWFALEANALRRWTLQRQGWRFVGIAAGSDRFEAEQRYFARREQASPPPPPTRPAAPAHEPVLGVFPQPWSQPR